VGVDVDQPPSQRDDDDRYLKLAEDAYLLAWRGRFLKAERLFRWVPAPTTLSRWGYDRTRAAIAIASGLIERGAIARAAELLRDARRACAAMSDGAAWPVALCLTQIAPLLVAVGARDEALGAWAEAARLAEGQQDLAARCVGILEEIAWALTGVGESDRASAVARSIIVDEIRDRALSDIAERAHRGGEEPGAGAAPRGPGDTPGTAPWEQEERWETLGIDAQELAGAGRIQEARALVDEIPAPARLSGWGFEKVVALLVIASKQIEERSTDDARRTLDLARAASEGLHENAVWQEAYLLECVASLLLRTGARDEAIAVWSQAAPLAQTRQDDDECLQILRRLARHLVRAGEVSRAIGVAHAITRQGIREIALCHIGDHLHGLEEGRWTYVTRSRDDPTAPIDPAPAYEPTEEEREEDRLQDVALEAQQLARSGRTGEALEVVRRIPVPSGDSGWGRERTVALVEIASSLVDQGALSHAHQVLDEAQGSVEAVRDEAPWNAAEGFAEIARVLVKMGARDAAVATWMKAARLAPTCQDADRMLGRITGELARIGELERATEVARSIEPWRHRRPAHEAGPPFLWPVGGMGTRDRTLWEIAVRARGGSPEAVPSEYRAGWPG
jgi:tetratricopeptide (TPR) repeat protein